MDIKKQAVNEYLTQGFTYRQLADKYGVSRSTINTWENEATLTLSFP